MSMRAMVMFDVIKARNYAANATKAYHSPNYEIQKIPRDILEWLIENVGEEGKDWFMSWNPTGQNRFLFGIVLNDDNFAVHMRLQFASAIRIEEIR